MKTTFISLFLFGSIFVSPFVAHADISQSLYNQKFQYFAKTSPPWPMVQMGTGITGTFGDFQLALDSVSATHNTQVFLYECATEADCLHPEQAGSLVLTQTSGTVGVNGSAGLYTLTGGGTYTAVSSKYYSFTIKNTSDFNAVWLYGTLSASAWLYETAKITTSGVYAGPWLSDDNTTYPVYAYFHAYGVSYGPPDPTTDFNEVTNYIPDTGVSTTTGVMNIGAHFSIPQPDLVEYFGYRLLSPNGTIVYDATTTANGVPGSYDIASSYNFSIPGLYTGHAYWGQIFGGNLWEVDNPSLQQILVDVPEWTITPDGHWSGAAATTSTTTLPNLSLDCGTGFAGSVCNLAAALFLPSSASIAGVQASWASVLNKAPFNFFVQSKTILDSLTVDINDVPDNTLSITMFGKTFDVISTTTAARIGLDDGLIGTGQVLMTVGMFILLAWFLYWRIASIFGV